MSLSHAKSVAMLTKKGTDLCSVCNCLQYGLTRRDQDAPQRSSLTVLRDRYFEDFDRSATQGCGFCDIVAQSFLLLQSVIPGMQVELLLYPQSPAELHSLASKDVYDVVEMYPYSGEPHCSIATRVDLPLSKSYTIDTNQSYVKLGKDVPRVSTMEASVQFLQEQYYSCIVEHTECQHKTYPLPKRIVDISESQYRLLEPAIGSEDMYAALSYTWGSKGFAMTTSMNYEELRNGFDRDLLPVVFRDAAAVAKSLGIRYLWIDTLCIIQDNHSDWEEQAARMGEVFEGATVTIAAASSSDPDSTLFSTRDRKHEEVELFSSKIQQSAGVIFRARRKIDRGIHAKTGRTTNLDPLDKRAWGLQEKMLSPRMLAFTGAELQWTCRTLKTCECHTNPYPSDPLFTAPSRLASNKRALIYARAWSRIVEEYSARDLTHLRDKLPAVGGLACRFGTITRFTYIAGLWKESLLYDLVWQRDGVPLQPSCTWLGPSFSWVSTRSAVNFRFARHSYPGSRIPHAEILGLYYRTTAKDTYSQAKDGVLTIQGHTVSAVLRQFSHEVSAYAICFDDTVYWPHADQQAICEFSIDASVSHSTQAPDQVRFERVQHEEAVNGTCQYLERPIILLSLYSIHHRRYLYQNFLILTKSDHDADTYERVGIGSGKLYRGTDREASIPSEPWLVRPFEWLSADRGRDVEAAEVVMCLR